MQQICLQELLLVLEVLDWHSRCSESHAAVPAQNLQHQQQLSQADLLRATLLPVLRCSIDGSDDAVPLEQRGHMVQRLSGVTILPSRRGLAMPDPGTVSLSRGYQGAQLMLAPVVLVLWKVQRGKAATRAAQCRSHVRVALALIAGAQQVCWHLAVHGAAGQLGLGPLILVQPAPVTMVFEMVMSMSSACNQARCITTAAGGPACCWPGCNLGSAGMRWLTAVRHWRHRPVLLGDAWSRTC